MTHMIVVSLPVRDLPGLTAFYEGLGFTKNAWFLDNSTSSLMPSEAIIFMPGTHEKFTGFLTKPLGDFTAATFAMIALSSPSRETVASFVDKALATGGSPARDTDDVGFMYGRSLHDPDGHLIEPVLMDPVTIQ